MKRLFPALIAIVIGFVTLAGLLIAPFISQLLLSWGGVLAAFALLTGVLNLMRVHLGRATKETNVNSLALVLSLWIVLFLAVTDRIGVTEGAVAEVFYSIQSPLETAVAGLLAFVLLMAGIRMMQRQRTGWTALFLSAAVFTLVSTAGIPAIQATLLPVTRIIESVIVTAGVRGLLIGVALGSVMIAIRLLLGVDQPYNQ